MRRTTQTLFLLSVVAVAAWARDAHIVRAPNNAWTMEIPESWEAAKSEDYDKLQSNVHAVFVGPGGDGQPTNPNGEAKEKPFRDYLMVSLVNETTYVQAGACEERRALRQQELSKGGMQTGIERIVVEKISDRDAYREEGWLITPDGKPLKNIKWTIPAEDRTYTFSFTATGENYPYKLVAFEAMARSIKMADPAPSPPSKALDWRLATTVGGAVLFGACAIAFVFVLRRQMKPPAQA